VTRPKQAGGSLEKYFTDPQGRWREIDFRRPNPMKCVADIQHYDDMLQEDSVYVFLDSLDDWLDKIRGDILQMHPVPYDQTSVRSSLTQVYFSGCFLNLSLVAILVCWQHHLCGWCLIELFVVNIKKKKKNEKKKKKKGFAVCFHGGLSGYFPSCLPHFLIVCGDICLYLVSLQRGESHIHHS